jgi:hypothetical protein
MAISKAKPEHVPEHVEEELKIVKAMGAGFMATIAMTIVVLAAPLIGLPKADYFSLLGALFIGSASETWGTIVGVLWHFNFGVIIIPHVYVFAIYPILPNPPWLKGLIFGAGLWFILQTLMMPMIGAGFFSRHTDQPLYNVVGSLIVHLIYGTLFGSLAGKVREIHLDVYEIHAIHSK